MLRKPKLTAFLLLLSAVTVLYGGTSGKIVGKITDSEGGTPLVAANIVIKDQGMGAASDAEGNYLILNVPPGVYELVASYVGYTTTTITNVLVSSDLTTTIDFKMNVESFKGESVVVVANRPMIQKDATATAAVVGADELEASPVQSFSEMAQTKAGVNVGPDGTLHVRGGRSSEVGYIVDGITVTNAVNGGMNMDIATNAIEEMSIISGGFNAEYGQAMSGIVSIVTREGSAKFSGNLSFKTGGILTNPDNSKYFLSKIAEYDPMNTTQTELRLSGPILGERITANLSLKYLDDKGYLYGERLYNTLGVADTASADYGELVSLNSQKKLNLQNKFKLKLTDNINVYLTTIYEDYSYQTYSHTRSKVPDGIPFSYNTTLQEILKISHSLSPKTYYSLALGYMDHVHDYYLNEDPTSTDYVWDGYSTGQYFYLAGTDNFREHATENHLTAKFDFTTNAVDNNEIKVGFEFKQLDLTDHSYYVTADRRDEPFTDANNNGAYDAGESYIDINGDGTWNEARDDNQNGIPGDIIELTGWTNDSWARKPVEFATYIQDKIELQDMVLNIGLRLDYFDPDGRVLSDPTDPDIYNPIKNENIWRDYGSDGLEGTDDADGTEDNGIQDPGEESISLEEREAYWYKEVDPTMQLSPRISFAFPISDKGKLFFSYGHFFQLPPYTYLYTDYNNAVKPGLIETDMGNPGLKPQKTVSYEVGVEQQLMDDVAGYLKIYQRDMSNIIGQDVIVLPNTDAYAIYVNRAYGRIRGFNFSLVKRFSSFFSATVDYTYQTAEGNESNPSQGRLDYRYQEEALKKIVPLDWDQTHALRVNATIADKSNWLVSMIGRIESGYPYTPMGANETVKIAEENSANKIPIIKFDLNMKKNFRIGTANVAVYAQVYNLFDRLNENYVWDATGRATYGLGLYGGEYDEDWQRRPQWFYTPRELYMGMEYSF